MHKVFWIAALLLLFAQGAMALQVEVPATIVVWQEQEDVPVRIWNDSDFEESYRISVSGLPNAVVSPSYGKIASGRTELVTLSFSPDEALANATYEMALIVELGEERAAKNVRILFKGSEKPGNGNGAVPVGFISLAYFGEWAAGMFTFGNILNGLLALIAAVLLIAFIARFVKRLEAGKVNNLWQ